MRTTSNEKYYVALYDPQGIDEVVTAAGVTTVDRPHVTLFPYVNEGNDPYGKPVRQKLVESIQFIRKTIAGAGLSMTTTDVQQLNDGTYGYRLAPDAQVNGILDNVAEFLHRSAMIPTNAFGDQYDQQVGGLHMSLFPEQRDERMYKKVIDAMRGFLNRTVSFGDVSFEPSKWSSMNIKLADVGVVAFRQHLTSWTEEELADGFIPGLLDKGVNELGLYTTAGDLIFDEHMLRAGAYDDVSDINSVIRSEGRDDKVAYNSHMNRIASARIASEADDESLYR